MYSFLKLTVHDLNIVRSSQMKEEFWVKSEQFISLTALPCIP